MSKGIKVFIVIVATILLTASVVWAYNNIYLNSESADTTLSIDEENSIAQPVATYLELLPKSGPPELDETAIESMVDLLSSYARENLQQPYSRGLAMFAGIQDLPDQGTNIIEVSNVSENGAEVLTHWGYSGSPTVKTFVMVKEGSTWKINAIK